MEAVKSTAAVSAKTTTQAKGLDTWFNRQAELFEKTRFGWMAILMIIQSCLGSIAVMYVLQNNSGDVMLIAAAMVTMACNSILIAQGSGKLCLGSFYLSLLVNTAIIVIAY